VKENNEFVQIEESKNVEQIEEVKVDKQVNVSANRMIED
jgi:hypothetical protein